MITCGFMHHGGIDLRKLVGPCIYFSPRHTMLVNPTNLRNLVETGSHFRMANSLSLPALIPTRISRTKGCVWASQVRPIPKVSCPYERKMGAVSTKFRRCEGLPVAALSQFSPRPPPCPGTHPPHARHLQKRWFDIRVDDAVSNICQALHTAALHRGVDGRGCTLVHFSAQPKPFPTHNTP